MYFCFEIYNNTIILAQNVFLFWNYKEGKKGGEKPENQVIYAPAPSSPSVAIVTKLKVACNGINIGLLSAGPAMTLCIH